MALAFPGDADQTKDFSSLADDVELGLVSMLQKFLRP